MLGTLANVTYVLHFITLTMEGGVNLTYAPVPSHPIPLSLNSSEVT